MKRKLLTSLVLLSVAVAVVFVFCGMGNNPEKTEIEPALSISGEVRDKTLTSFEKEPQKKPGTQNGEELKDEFAENSKAQDSAEEKKADESLTDNSTDEKRENILKCTLSVRCDTVFENISKFDKEKLEILPADGMIFPETKVVFYDGESVFNVLKRELKKNKIHIDFENTPMYNTVYIKGISNLYEHDCGELSGWIYIVNGKIPNYGCSQYILKANDKVEFVYTCDLGKDIDL